MAGFGLPHAPAAPAEPLADGDWQELLLAVRHERIEGLLGAAVDAGAWPVTAEQLVQVREAARGRARLDLSLEHGLLVAVRTLEDAGVACRVLKGQAWAHTVYPDPSWRGAGDIDLLVHSDDWYHAIEVLRISGAVRTWPELRPGFDRRFGKDATLIGPGGWQLDLHRTLVVGPFGLWIDEDDLFVRPVLFSVGGVTMATLNHEASFLHACYNAALADDPPKLIAVRDVCQMASAVALEPTAVVEMARRWRAPAVIVRALALAAELLGEILWSAPAAEPFSTRRGSVLERALVASYRGPGRGYTSQLAAVVAVGGIRDRLAYLDALARPQPDYRFARGWSPMGSVQAAARRIWKSR